MQTSHIPFRLPALRWHIRFPNRNGVTQVPRRRAVLIAIPLLFGCSVKPPVATAPTPQEVFVKRAPDKVWDIAGSNPAVPIGGSDLLANALVRGDVLSLRGRPSRCVPIAFIASAPVTVQGK